jgi:5S rRNA maturation endonuclease (ribonuclease M5)
MGMNDAVRADAFLARFIGGCSKVSGPDANGEYTALCPVHPDTNPSMTFRAGSRPGDRKPVVACCHANCSISEIYEALGLPYRAAYGQYARLGRTHWYDAADGTPVGYIKIATDARGNRLKGVSPERWPVGARFPVYRAPEVRAGIEAGAQITICEGEKDADALADLGYVTTCFPSGGIATRHTEALRGAKVVIIADSDEAGAARMRRAYAAVADAGIEVARVEVVRLPGGKDIADAIEALEAVVAVDGWPASIASSLSELLVEGDPEADDPAANRLLETRRRERCVKQILDEEEAAKQLAGVGELMRAKALTFDDACGIMPQPYLVEGLVPAPGVTMFAADPATYKSFTSIDIACHVAAGSTSWHGLDLKPGRAAYVMAEGSSGLGQRCKAWQAENPSLSIDGNALLIYPDAVDLSIPGAGEPLLQWIGPHDSERPLRLLVIDTLRRVSGALNENLAEIGAVTSSLVAVRREHPEVAIVIVHHFNKQGQMSGSTALRGNADAVITFRRVAKPLTTLIQDEKQKDAAGGVLYELTLRPHVVGQTPTGKPVDSLAVTAVREATAEHAEGVRLSASALAALRAARDASKRRTDGVVPQPEIERATSKTAASRGTKELAGLGFLKEVLRPDGYGGKARKFYTLTGGKVASDDQAAT